MCLMYIVVLEDVGGHKTCEERNQGQQGRNYTDHMEAG